MVGFSEGGSLATQSNPLDLPLVFGANAGQQCVTMSLYALVHDSVKGINSCNDLVQIMTTGNELYSILSQSTGRSYLMISMLEENYQLKYRES